jgi:hypothetical protein
LYFSCVFEEPNGCLVPIAVVSMNWEYDELSLALPKRAGIAARSQDAGPA